MKRYLQLQSLALRLGVFALALRTLTGCTSEPYNFETYCELNGPTQSLRLVQYEQEQPRLLPHSGGHLIAGALIYRQNTSETWLWSYIDTSYLDYYSKLVCDRSSFHEETAIVFPLYLTGMLNKQVVQSDQLQYKPNSFLIKQGPSDSFHLKEVEAGGAPYLLDERGALQNVGVWDTTQIRLYGDVVIAEQIVLHREAMETLETQFGSYRYYEILMSYSILHPDRTGCDFCEPLMKRLMISNDDGSTWRLESYQVLAPLDSGVSVRGADYAYDKELGRYVKKGSMSGDSP